MIKHKMGVKLIIFFCMLGFVGLINTLPVQGASTYRLPGDVPKFPDSDFKSAGTSVEMGSLKIDGATKDAFTGGTEYRAEFRLPTDFYINSVGEYGSGSDVEIQRGLGFEDNTLEVTINPISEDRNHSGQYRGWEVIVDSIVAPTDDVPKLILYFNKIYIPRGYTGNIVLSVDAGESGGFSTGDITIGVVQAAQITVEVEEVQYIDESQTLGPIKISENMAGTFEYIELALPGGFTWKPDTCYLDAVLGLRDLDGNGDEIDDFEVSEIENKYGQSVLRIETRTDSGTGEKLKSTSIGKLSIECEVETNDDSITYGDVSAKLTGNADPSPTSIKVGSYSEQKISLTAGTATTLYSGLREQDIPNITIAENSPNTLISDRTITLSLPDWAAWASIPNIQIEGGDTLDVGDAYLKNDDADLCFVISSSSEDKPGKIVIKEPEINLSIEASGDLAVKLDGESSGITGEVTVGKVNLPLAINATSKPSLVLGKIGQLAGDIEIKETASQVLLTGQLWLDFPQGIILSKVPKVKVTSGDVQLGQAWKDESDPDVQRVVVSIDRSSSSASTILVSDIIYDIGQLSPDGDVEVEVGGTAINEVNWGTNPLFPDSKTLIRIVNATVSPAPVTVPQAPVLPTAVFTIGEATYEVNGQKIPMDVAPYVLKDRTFLPLRFAAEALGVPSGDIVWDGNSQVVSLFRNGLVVQLKIGENAINTSGISVPMDGPAHIKDGRVMVPLRALATALGAQVIWDAANANTITLKL